MIARRLALAALFIPGVAAAQLPTNPARPQTTPDTGRTAQPPRAPGDTTRRDTTHRDTTQAPRVLVTWEEPDSVMQSILDRAGYNITRYQGKQAAFNATGRTLTLSGSSAVQHDQATLVADTIFYDDSTKTVRAASAPRDTIVLRDPTLGTSDVVALGGMEYDLNAHHGIVRQLSTSSAQAGQTWFLHGGKAAVVGDTTGMGRNTSYAEEGAITSCDLPYPHYHFQSKEIKMISKRLLVARPAVLYISDIPVMWLPFIVQDMRTGRRSGILPPGIGLSNVIRNSPTYTRQIDNLGYYFAINDYMDATIKFGWRSSLADSIPGNAGWTYYVADWNYAWLDRFLSGGVSGSYWRYSDGARAYNLSWRHQQQFSQSSSFNTNINYSSNTTALQRQAFTAAAAFAAITSSLNFQQGFGPAKVSIGGSRSQYTGRAFVSQNFPNITVSTPPVSIGSWLLWSPALSATNAQTFNKDVAQFHFSPSPTGTGYDSTSVLGNDRATSVNFDTPLRIFGFTWQNSFRFNDNSRDYPQFIKLLDLTSGDSIGSRTFGRTYETELYWNTGISLPTLLQGTFNLTPSVSIVNADQSRPFWTRTTFTGGRFVQQNKTLQYGLSSSPTLFGFYPGFGPFSRIRHSIQPRISVAYSPAANISDDMLQAYNLSRRGYLGNIPHGTVTLQLDQVFEAKLRSQSDTNPEGGEKIKLLSLNFSPLTYDFERKRRTGMSGFITPTFSYRVASDLLPGFDLSVDYSLYQGDVLSDTAKFKPFRTGISARLTLGRNNNPFAAISRIFGNPTTTPDTATAEAASESQQALNQQPGFGGITRAGQPAAINTSGGWTASLDFTSSRTRPIVGALVVDPRNFCKQFLNIPGAADAYQRCLAQPFAADSVSNPYGGSQLIVTPARATLRGNLAFSLTPKWAMQWTTGYDFELHQFSDHSVTLQRDMHDWRANFSFSRAPTGNFLFSFYISLKAQPDLKFDYHRSTYRCPAGSTNCTAFPTNY